jgi:chromosome segregation ATPase
MQSGNGDDYYIFSQIEEKLRFLADCIAQVEEQIREREHQRDDLLSELLQKTCDINTAIAAADPYLPRKTALETEFNDIEEEMRKQKVDCWRDISALQKELRQLKREYRAVRAGALCSQQKR